MTHRARFFEGKKYMWDGTEYEREAQGREVEKEYTANGFDVRVCCEEGKVFVYSRRVISAAAVDEG
ncbi:MAG: hypothetical protein HKM89_12650 [Gemmatimonadales bacterium]|nr:hypothetical protein [Gemmatimonadales bacterium]